MMIAFGECGEPDPETLKKLEIYLIDFLGTILRDAYTKSQRAGYK